MRTIITSLLLFITIIGSSQNNSIILSDNANIIQSGTVNVYVNQPNINGIIKTGTQTGGIISNDEQSRIIWKSGSNTGNYTIPYKTTEGNLIPITINKTTPGTILSKGELITSTYHTIPNNTPYPSNSDIWVNDVTNMIGITGLDNSNNTADRFWIIIFNGYSVNPTTTLTLSYDGAGAITDIVGIVEPNLQAQYWDGALWNLPTIGTVNIINDYVNNIGNVDFSAQWVLVDQNFPMPITDLDFSAIVDFPDVQLNWTTATESNNDYFIIQRSYDMINWTNISTVNGYGTSNVTQQYTTIDFKPGCGTIYYRLIQVDYNGYSTTLEPTSVFIDCEHGISIFPNPTLQGQPPTITGITNKTVVQIYDVCGRECDIMFLNSGTYSVVIDGIFVTKLVVL